MAKEIDYDQCYATLTLTPGATLAQIEEAWKTLAQFLHPDNWPDGPMKEKSTRKLQDLNIARDQLRDYWRKHNAAPPSKLRGTVAEGPGPGTGAPPPESKEEPKSTAPPPKRKAESGDIPRPPIALGPPPFLKTPLYHIYDVLNSRDESALGLQIFLWLVAATVPFLLVAAMLNVVGRAFYITPRVSVRFFRVELVPVA